MYPHSLRIPALGIILGPAVASTLIAAAIGLALGPWLARRLEGIEPRRTRRVQLALVIVGLYGGHLLWVFNHWPYVWARTIEVGPYDLLAPWNGLHAPGSIIALLLAGPWIFARGGVSVGKFADLTTPLVGLALVVVRLGCLLQGCCWGTRCDAAWCIAYPPGSSAFESQRVLRLIPADAAHSLPLHPLQLYFAAAALALALGALLLYRRKQYDGQIALAGLLWFAATSTGLEFLRAEYSTRAYVGALPQLAWLNLMLGACAAGGLLAGHLVVRRRAPGREGPAAA